MTIPSDKNIGFDNHHEERIPLKLRLGCQGLLEIYEDRDRV